MIFIGRWPFYTGGREDMFHCTYGTARKQVYIKLRALA